jgi:nucleoid DNA-binding protein
MTKSDLARMLAKQSRVSRAEAADQLDRVVNQIITRLRQGHSARLPGLGEFTPGREWDFRFDAGKSGKRGADDK